MYIQVLDTTLPLCVPPPRSKKTAVSTGISILSLSLSALIFPPQHQTSSFSTRNLVMAAQDPVVHTPLVPVVPAPPVPTPASPVASYPSTTPSPVAPRLVSAEYDSDSIDKEYVATEDVYAENGEISDTGSVAPTEIDPSCAVSQAFVHHRHRTL